MAEHSQPSLKLLCLNNKSPVTDVPINFADVYRDHRFTIYRYVLARIGHVDDAHDITAQVFLKAYRHFDSYRQDAPLIAWLMGITRNQLVDYYRGQREQVSLAIIEDIPDTDLSPEASLEYKTRMKRVADALSSLSEDRREAIAMRLFAGLSNPEIAEVMDKSPEAVAMLVYRGVQDLKMRLSEEA